MKVSVILAARNAAPTIERALRSIAQQTHLPVETIVIDDGSSDSTAEIALAFSGIDLRLLRVNFSNAAASRNAGMNIARGDWIAFLDADDEWYPRHLEIAASTLASSEDVAYMAAADYTDNRGRKLSLNPSRRAPGTESHLDHASFISRFKRRSWFCHCTVLQHKSAVDAVEGFNESLVRRHDLDLFLRVIHGRTWTYSPVPAGKMRLGTPGSISQHRVSCDLYFLRSLVGLLPSYDSRDYRAILQNRARCAINSALSLGSDHDVREAWELGHRYIGLPKRWFYQCAVQAPGMAGQIVRLGRTRNGSLKSEFWPRASG